MLCPESLQYGVGVGWIKPWQHVTPWHQRSSCVVQLCLHGALLCCTTCLHCFILWKKGLKTWSQKSFQTLQKLSEPLQQESRHPESSWEDWTLQSHDLDPCSVFSAVIIIPTAARVLLRTHFLAMTWDQVLLSRWNVRLHWCTSRQLPARNKEFAAGGQWYTSFHFHQTGSSACAAPVHIPNTYKKATFASWLTTSRAQKVTKDFQRHNAI